MPANSLMAGVHNSQARMPAILPRDARESWLFGNIEAAGAALVAYPADRMIAYREPPGQLGAQITTKPCWIP